MTEPTDGGPWAGPDRREWLRRMHSTYRPIRLLVDDELVPRAPDGFHTLQIGLTAHLARIGVLDAAICGAQQGTKPRGPAIGVCLDCRAIAH